MLKLKILIISLTSILSSIDIRNLSDIKIEFKGMTFVGDRYCPEVSFTSEESKISLTKLSQTGANWVAIVVTEYQNYLNSSEIFPIYENFPSNDYYTFKTESIQGIINMIKTAKDLNLKVMLKPHVDVIKIEDKNFDWRGNIGIGMNYEIKNKWFDSYEKMITKYAKLAQDNNVELFSVGCELLTMSQYDSDWRKIIKSIRNVYNGKLVDSANHDGEEFYKTWWDDLDYIGVDAYYLPENYSSYLEGKELENFYQPIVSKLEDLSKKFNKDVIITEVGFCSGQCKRDFVPNIKNQIDFAKIYLEFYKNFMKSKYIKGIFWWAWNSDPNFGGLNDPCISPQNKLTENILRFLYKGSKIEANVIPSGKSKCKCTV